MTNMILQGHIVGQSFFAALGRYCMVLGVVFLVTGSLLLMMQCLISSTDVEILPVSEGSTLTITRVLENEEPAKKDPKPKPPASNTAHFNQADSGIFPLLREPA